MVWEGLALSDLELLLVSATTPPKLQYTCYSNTLTGPMAIGGSLFRGFIEDGPDSSASQTPERSSTH